jgi:hypothetical protein
LLPSVRRAFAKKNVFQKVTFHFGSKRAHPNGTGDSGFIWQTVRVEPICCPVAPVRLGLRRRLSSDMLSK